MEELKREIEQIISADNISYNELMKKHTTFGVGGPADVFVRPEDTTQLSNVIALCNRVNVPYFILGNGSNLLVSDEGYRGVVIHVGRKIAAIETKGNTIYALAGALLSKVSHEALNKGLTGLEFAAGIPGTIGGAMVMNAGAYGGEMSQVVKTVTLVDPDGHILILTGDQMMFSYRHSILKEKPFTVLSVELQLTPGDIEEIRSKQEGYLKSRSEKQPLNFPSAGSTFKRPEGYFAGKLIEDAGLRGYAVGDAQVSEKHCGFVINRGKATAAQIKELIDYIIANVKEKYGVTLEPEVVFLGRF